MSHMETVECFLMRIYCDEANLWSNPDDFAESSFFLEMIMWNNLDIIITGVCLGQATNSSNELFQCQAGSSLHVAGVSCWRFFEK